MKLYIVDSELEQLTSIAGINEEIANKILDFVESSEFGELNDLEKVEGVGPELLTRISTRSHFCRVLSTSEVTDCLSHTST